MDEVVQRKVHGNSLNASPLEDLRVKDESEKHFVKDAKFLEVLQTKPRDVQRDGRCVNR